MMLSSPKFQDPVGGIRYDIDTPIVWVYILCVELTSIIMEESCVWML